MAGPPARLGKSVRSAGCGIVRASYSDRLTAALAALTDDDLAALAAGTYAEGTPSPGLMAWLEHLADWERHRRVAVELPLMPPEAAIDESEADAALATAIVLRDSFAEEPDVHALLSAVADAFAGTGTRQ